MKKHAYAWRKPRGSLLNSSQLAMSSKSKKDRRSREGGFIWRVISGFFEAVWAVISIFFFWLD